MGRKPLDGSGTAGVTTWCSPLLLLGVLFGIHLWLFGDREWVHAVLLEQAEATARAGEEGGEEALRAMEAALDSGAIGVLLGGRAIWTVARSHLVFWGIALPLVLVMAERRGRLNELVSSASGFLWIIALGIGANGILRWVTVKLHGTFSPAFFLTWFDGRILLHDLAIKSDLFLLLYLWAVATRWSEILGEHRVVLAAALFLPWLLLTLLFFHGESSFILTY